MSYFKCLINTLLIFATVLWGFSINNCLWLLCLLLRASNSPRYYILSGSGSPTYSFCLMLHYIKKGPIVFFILQMINWVLKRLPMVTKLVRSKMSGSLCCLFILSEDLSLSTIYYIYWVQNKQVLVLKEKVKL